MNAFLSKHENDVIGKLSGFDRLVFRGTLRPSAHQQIAHEFGFSGV
ncbi:hypothetical protein [Candidatus Magnetaquicoccus inordinatus]|nr:hypothetical protein [Candidatus Magnetaquicoccus inordinatus]